MSTYPPQFNQQNYQAQQSYYGQAATTVGQVMKNVYLRMTGGLLVTALVSLFCATSSAFISLLMYNSWIMWIFIIAEFALVFGISGGINRMKSSTAAMLFYLFAVVNGFMLSTIFLAYSITAIVKAFFITAGTFGAMTVYGYSTNRDLSRMGSLLFMALIGLIIASLVNIFLKSSGFDFIISILGVLIFVGLTAWDTQQIKTMIATMPGASAAKIATLGALSLYLDFINLFLYVLRLFGGNRD
jgi:FtsH-binding integral membrane protein